MWTSFQDTFGRVLVMMGALAFACWGYFTLNQLCFQSAARHVLERQMLHASALERNDPGQLHGWLTRPRHGDVLGHLEIARVGVSVVVLEGSDSRILAVAAGHIEGTALPGSIGNVGIAAHRDTFFHSLQRIRTNDTIRLTTAHGTFQYQVDRTDVVLPAATEVLDQSTSSELTLVTCYPFGYIGAAPKRFIVHAHQLNQLPFSQTL